MVSWREAANHFWWYKSVDVDWDENYFTCPRCGEKIYEHEWQGVGKSYPNYYVPCPHCGEDIIVDEEERKRTQLEDDLIVLMNTIGL